MLIANTLKGNLNSQKSMNASWLVTTIKAILKTPIQKFEKPILSFRRTHEAAVSNSKILAAFTHTPTENPSTNIHGNQQIFTT